LQSYRTILQVHGLGEEVDAYSRLIHIIKRVVHKACDQGCLADTLFPKKDELKFLERVIKVVGLRHDQSVSV
jgi:hypothetical protein